MDGNSITPKLLVIIADRDEKRLEEFLRERHIHFHYMFNGMGTASSEILKAFGLSGTEKKVCICIEPSFKAKPLMDAVSERMEFTRPGRGIAFIMPVSGVSAFISNALGSVFEQHKERLMRHMDMEAEKTTEEARFEMVISVINQGFSETLIEAAKKAGARGGTIIPARHMGVDDNVRFFGISIQEEKEIVSILIPRSQKHVLMEAIVKACGIRTEARGIIVSLPVESCAGLSFAEQ